MSSIPKENPSVWVVVPAFNEAERLDRTLDTLTGVASQVVVVNDGATDDTTQAALNHPVWLLTHLFNLGQGAALQTGIDFALAQGADIIVTFDADGQHCPDEIARLIEPVRSGDVDVALGSRTLGAVEGIPWTRRLILWAGVWFTRFVSGIRVTDTHNGFRALSRHAATRLRITQNRMAHASEILDQIIRYQLRYREVPVTIRYTQDSLAKGQSSWNAARIAVQFLLGRWIR